MSDYRTLERVLSEILNDIEPSRNDTAVRQQVIDDLRAVVRSVGSLTGATVEPFGSFISNLFTRWGDLDISIDLPNTSYASTAHHTQNLLRNLFSALNIRAGWHSLEFIPDATVPILKMKSNRQNISCDISINNLKGHVKSKYLSWISGIDARFRDLVLLVKQWAKAHDINCPRDHTLSSYSLYLLIIFHFQTCTPAIMPPLKEIYPTNIFYAYSDVDVVESEIEETCALNIATFKLQAYRSVNRSSLSELFVSFLQKFSEIGRRAPNVAICTFTGQWIPKTYIMLQRRTKLYIKDPFEQHQNAAMAVWNTELPRIAEAFRGTHSVLVSNNVNRHSIITAIKGY